MLPPNCEFVVNFAPELEEIISEAKYLEKLGFAVPELARSVALQEDKFTGFCDGLNRCLSRYHHVLASLSDAEVREKAAMIEQIVSASSMPVGQPISLSVKTISGGL